MVREPRSKLTSTPLLEQGVHFARYIVDKLDTVRTLSKGMYYAVIVVSTQNAITINSRASVAIVLRCEASGR